MNRLIDFSDGENNYRVPESEVETFKASVPNARRMSQFVGKDGSRYSVPEDEVDAFKASVPDTEELNSFQLSNGERYAVKQSRVSKFLRSRQYREGDAEAIAAKRAEIDAATPEVDAQGGASAFGEAFLKGGVRTAGKYGRAITGMVTDSLRLAGMIFGGRDNALVKGADWANDKWDWFSEDLGIGGKSGDKKTDRWASAGEMFTSGLASIMPWLIGGGVASKGARMALKGVSSLAAGGSSATDMYDELKANGADEATAYRGALTAGAVSTAFAYTFGTLSAENFLKGAGAKEASKLIAGEVVAKKKGFNEIVRSVANGRMRGDIMNFLVGAAEEGVTEGAESFVLNVLKQHGSGEDVDLEEALLKALPDAAAGAALGGVMTGARAYEWAKNGGPRKFYEKQARAEVSQLMNDMAPGDIREMNPKAFDAAAKKRRLGGTVSRKDGEEIGLPPNWTQEQRNEVIDEWNHEQTARKQKRAKVDGYQDFALRKVIGGFTSDTADAQRIYDRVTMKLKDASVLDDPVQREKIVMQAAKAVWNEDQSQRIGGARQKARMAEKADHEARVAEAEAQATEAAQRAENDAQERTNAEMLARETKRYNDFMLAREEARAKGGQNETRTDEAQSQPEQAQPVTPPAGETARSVEAGAAPSEVGGKVKTPKWVKEAPPAKSVVGKDGKRIVSIPRNGQSGKSREPSAILGAVKSIRGISAKIPATKQNPGREIFVDKTTQGEFANSGATKFLNARSKKGTDTEKEWAKKTLSAKVSAIPYLRDIIATAKNERHTPYEQIKNTPGHEKKNAQWGGGLYEYDVSFAVDGERYKGRMIVRCDSKGKMSLYDIVDIDDGSAVAKEMLLDKNKRSQVRSTANDKDERFSTSTQSVSNTNVEVKGVLNEKNRSRASYTSKGETKDSTASTSNIVSNSSSRINADAMSTPTKPKTTPKSEPKAKTKAEVKEESETKSKSEVKELKRETAPSITPAEAMKKLGYLGGADVDTLSKALAREERAGHTERANMIRVLRDYKRGVGTNPNPQSDETSGGKYRASVESAKPLDDPAFLAWAKKRGVAPTTQKRNEYDKVMADTLANRLNRWIKGVSVKTVNFISPEEGGDVRHGINQEEYDAWNKVLDDYEQGKVLPGDQKTILPRTPAVLLKIGASNRPIAIHGGIIDKIVGKVLTKSGDRHEVPISELRNLQIELDNPIAVFRSKTDSNSLVVLTRIVDKNNNEKAVVALKLDAKVGRSHIVNSIASIHGRPTYQVNNWIGEGHLLYVNKEARKNTARWLQLPGDKVLRASGIFTEKDFSNEELGRIIPKPAADSNDIRHLHDGERIVGSYNRATGEVKLAKGASVETVLHELGWHAARHWAEVNADSDPKAANLLKQMKGYAEDAPEDVKKAVRDTYGEMSADTLLDEIGAARFTKEQSGKIAEALATKEGAAWYQKVWNKVVDFYKDFLTKIGYNRVNLDGVEYMSSDVFGDFLADVMMSGKQLGERTAFSMEAPKGLAAKWTTNLSDYKAPIAELEKRTTGSPNNIYYLARTLEGQAQRGKNRAERAIKRVEKVLGEDTSPELLAQYMQLKAYEERNAKIERRNNKKDASGMTPEDAKAIEKTINESGVDEAIFKEAAQILWDLQTEGLQARVDAGLLDSHTAVKWMVDEPHHIPWRDAFDPDSGEYVGRKVGASEFDTAEGRKTAASGDPITWMLQEYQDAMTRAAQNRLRSSIANLTRLNGDVGTIYDGIQTDSKGKRSFIKYPKKGSGGTAKVLSIPEGVKLESTVKNDGGMKNVLTFKEGGETKYLVLNGSLGEAVAGAVTGRTLARPPAWISWTMRGYAATATALSPTFAVRNITADNFDIHNNLVAKYGWVKGEKMFGKIVKDQVSMAIELGSYIKHGDFKLGKDGKITDFQKLVEAYEDAGGLIGGMTTEGYEATVKKIQADFRAGKNRKRRLLPVTKEYWTRWQKMSELAPRLAVFKTAMESGMSAKDAAMLSRDITVDFNKKGEITPWFNTLWMFSNSALGANLTQMKGLVGKTGAKLAGGLVMYGFAEGMLEALMNGDDDDREKEGLASGKDINEYTRQNSLYVRKGDKVFRVNIHMGPFAYAKYFGNVMARTFSGMISPEKAAKELGLTAAEVAASFTGLGNVSGDALVQTAVPTIIQPFVQTATNKDYAGRAIKRAKHTESQPYSSHGRRSTSPVYHWIAKRINEFFGGNDYRKGKFLDEDMDIAPETVKVLTEMVGKNFVRDISEIAETGYKLLSGNVKDLDVRNVPFAGDVVRKQDGNDNRYYENYNRYRDDKHELKKQKGWTADERRAYLKEHPWLYSAGEPGVTRIDNIVKRIEKLRDVEESDHATDERKAEAKATRRKLQARVIEIMKGK